MSSRLENINEQRHQKLDKLRQQGVDPYPHRYERTHTTAQAIAELERREANDDPKQRILGIEDEDISVAGRLTAIRHMGKSSFADLRDGTGKIQLLFRKNDYDEPTQELLKDLDIGDIIGARGALMRTRTGEVTVGIKGFTLLTKSLQPLPEKWHGLADTEKRYRQRYLDLIANAEVRDVFIVRSRVIAAVRDFLNGRGFIEVETPVLQPAAGGALANPFVTHHHALDQDFYLRIALELHLKRLMVGGLDKVYEIGRIFRNEGISTKHNPEFTLLESYEAYADYNDVMAMTEQMLYAVSMEVLGTAEVAYQGNSISFKPPWPRLSLREAVKEHSGIDFNDYPEADALREKMRAMGMDAETGKSWAKLVDDLISDYVEPRLVQPTFLYDYPIAMSPLAKSKADDPETVERFEAFAGGGLEIANAYSELNDPLEQRQRFEAQLNQRDTTDEEKWTIDEDYLLALEYGMPPTGGLGIGIDRLVMLLTDQPSIREVILFPQLRDKG